MFITFVDLAWSDVHGVCYLKFLCDFVAFADLECVRGVGCASWCARCCVRLRFCQSPTNNRRGIARLARASGYACLRYPRRRPEQEVFISTLCSFSRLWAAGTVPSNFSARICMLLQLLECSLPVLACSRDVAFQPPPTQRDAAGCSKLIALKCEGGHSQSGVVSPPGMRIGLYLLPAAH